MKITIYTDGGSRNNPGPSAIGILIYDESGNEIMRHSDFLGTATNNIAEYCAVVAALEIAISLNAREINFYLDSALVVNQLNNVFKVKDEKMKLLYTKVKESEESFVPQSLTTPSPL